jgi:hypothetical protein
MSPQLTATLRKVLAVHYHGKDEPKYVIGALVMIAAEPTFTTKLAVESIRTAKKMFLEAMEGTGEFREWMKNPTKRAIVEQWSLSHSYSIRRSNGRNQEPLLAEADE